MIHLRRAFYSLIYCTMIFGPLGWIERYYNSTQPDSGEGGSYAVKVFLGCCSVAWVIFAAHAARPMCSAYLGMEPTEISREKDGESVS